MFEKTKRGSKNYRFVLRQNKTKIQLTHRGKSLNDNTVTHLDVNKKLNWRPILQVAKVRRVLQ